MFKPGRCDKAGKIFENLPWKDVYSKKAQILFNRVKGPGRTQGDCVPHYRCPFLALDFFTHSGNLLLEVLITSQRSGVIEMPILKNEKEALKELREKLHKLYWVRDMRVFGSKARGTDVEDSDIDVMIMLAECKPSIESEIDDLVFDINLKYDCLIVPLYFGEDELESGPLSEAPVYKRILSEGIQL